MPGTCRLHPEFSPVCISARVKCCSDRLRTIRLLCYRRSRNKAFRNRLGDTSRSFVARFEITLIHRYLVNGINVLFTVNLSRVIAHSTRTRLNILVATVKIVQNCVYEAENLFINDRNFPWNTELSARLNTTMIILFSIASCNFLSGNINNSEFTFLRWTSETNLLHVAQRSDDKLILI